MSRVVPPLTVYFDGSCPLCVGEVTALKAHDRDDALRLVDCAVPGFDDADAADAGIDRDALTRRIHARDAAGRWLSGIEVYEAMYRLAGFPGVAAMWGHPWLRPLWERGYPWLARNRKWLSRLGVGRIFGRLSRWERRNAETACAAGCRGAREADRHGPM